MTLTDFLLERIAEDEAATARYLDDYVPDGAWGLTRVLAECEAKRQIVGLGPSRCGGYDDPPDPEPLLRMKHYPDVDHKGYCDGCSAAMAADATWVQALFALALPYADHPDYRNEWRP